MLKNNEEIHLNDIPECFAEHFAGKMANIVANIGIDDQVFNGTRKLWKADQNFMTSENIVKAVQSIKMKNAEGDDRNPQRILIDGISIILSPLTTLFRKIYTMQTIPEQWKLAKITPVHKKGSKSDISNYRPVANLCSASKIFEKLILQRIQEIHYRMTKLLFLNVNAPIYDENKHILILILIRCS